MRNDVSLARFETGRLHVAVRDTYESSEHRPVVETKPLDDACAHIAS